MSSVNTRFTPHFGSSAEFKLFGTAKRGMAKVAEATSEQTPKPTGLLGRFESLLPITTKLNPFNFKNLEYLLVSATITRFLVAITRSEENRPKRLKTADMTPVEKKKAFAERCFIEFFGTSTYILLLHLGQDLASKFLERWQKDLIDTTKKTALAEIQAGQGKISPEAFSRAFDKVYGHSTKGLIGRILYGEQKTSGEFIQGTRRRFCEVLDIPLQQANEHLPNVMNTSFRLKPNLICTLAVLTGVAISASLGGYGIQWLNDHPFSQYLRKKYPESTPEGFLTLPNTSGHNLSFTSNPFQNATLLFQGGHK